MSSPSTDPSGSVSRRALDREILRLAVPAFGALVAEPLYVLADTAIVGRLGTAALGGLGVAGTVLTAVFGVFNFLAYATTAQVARRIGAGDRRGAVEQGIDGLWVAIGLGLALAAVGLVLAPAVVRAMGASAAVQPKALTYLRISLLGTPFVLLTLAAVGYLRGTQDTATPLVVAVGANVVNLVLELILVYAAGLGIAGSAWGTVVAQVLAAAVMVTLVARTARSAGARLRPSGEGVRRTVRVGVHLVVRTASLLGCFLVATAAASRIGDVAVAAHQVAFQLWYFLALALDAIAIAGQAIVGRVLGAGDRAGARRITDRMLQLGVGFGAVVGLAVVAGRPLLARIFTDDAAVRVLLEHTLWIVAAMQPLAAAVFVLDGVLIGAGETRYLARAMVAAAAVYLPIVVGVRLADHGLAAVWVALTVFVAARFAGMYARYRTDRWLVLGAVR